MAPDGLFKAMADPTRRKILQVLIRTELGVSELVEVLRLPQSTVSRHLKTLRDAGLVDARHRGTAAMYYPVCDQNGHDDGLAERIIAWTGEQGLPARLSTRLEAVLRRRRGESDAYFARIAHRWDRLRTDCFGAAFHLEALTALLPRDWSVVDVGAGTGYLLPTLARAFARVIAVDPVDEMLAAARQRGDAIDDGRVEFAKGSATQLPLADGEVNLCLAALVLHHEPTPIEALREFARVLKPDGVLLVIEQRAHQLHAFHELMQDRWWGFEPTELAEQTRAAGFANIVFRTLLTVEPSSSSAPEAPDLFVLTGRRSADTAGDGN